MVWPSSRHTSQWIESPVAAGPPNSASLKPHSGHSKCQNATTSLFAKFDMTWTSEAVQPRLSDSCPAVISIFGGMLNQPVERGQFADAVHVDQA
jgi:hypothetical protein